MLLCTSAWAETVTDVLNREFTGVANNAGYNDWSGKKSNSDAVYAGNSAGANNSIQLRTDKNNSGIVTTKSGGNVKEIVLTFQESTGGSRSVEIYGKSSAYLSPTELYADNTKGTLLGEIARSTDPITLTVNGDYQYIGLRSKTGALYLSEIKIEWEKVIVAKPEITFDPAAPYEGDNVTCSISCATEGASIQYSTDGENYNDYPADGFTLTENTTVYAKATLGEDESEVASKAIEFTPITTVANIAELTALSNNTVFRMTGSATVVYNDATKYIYIKDDTGYTLLYNSHDAAEKGYTVSNIVGTVSIYNGLFEAKETDFDVEVGDTQVDPTVMTIPNIAATNMNQYVKLENVSITAPVNQNFTITDAEEHTLQGRDNFSLQDFPNDVTDKKFDIEGFVGIYNGTIQFYPTNFTDVTPAAPFAITVNPVAGTYTEPVTVTITANDDQAMITYTLNGGNELDYTEPFTLNETTAVHVYATDGTNEATWDGTYTINIPEPVELDGMIVFQNNLNANGQPADSNTALTDAKGQIEKGSDYVKDAIVEGKIYPGASGLKFGSSGAGGTMTLNLKNTWNATKISFIAKRYNTDETKLTVNGNEFTLDNDFTLYEFVPENPVEAITFVTSGKNQRAYLKVINIEGQEIILEKTATPEISVTEGEESYTVTATGAGEVKLYQDNVEVENPCVVDRTSEEQTFVFTATAQEEGKGISDPAEQEVTVPALVVVESFGITVTPEAGTYTEPVTVTITATGLEEGQTATITYTLNGGDELDYTEPFTLNETTAVSVRATFGDKVATWTGTYTINLPIENPTGLIVFKSNNSDSSSALDGKGLIDEIDGDGTDYVLSAENITKVYAGKNGLKFGTGSGNGSMTLNLKGTWNANKISIIAKNYDDDAKFKVTVNGNSKEFNLSNDKAFHLYDFQLEQAQEVSAITFESTTRAYLKVINIEGEAPVIYRIKVDNEGGDYKGRADVKATLEPELEGATLTYTFAEDGATETPDEQPYPEAGVTVLKSGKLTFIARNGETELDRWEGNYTITPLIGDVNGDGKVDVGDVNYVVNIILGKINPNE